MLRIVKWWYEPFQTSKSNSSFLTKWFVTVKLLGVIFKWFLSDVLQYITLYSSLMWHNFKWRHKLRLQASAVIMMLTNNAIKVCLWRENFAGILFYASALVHVMCEQIILVWVDEIFFWELLLVIFCSIRQKTKKRKKTMENNSQTRFSRHSVMSFNIKGKRISKETQERKQSRGTPQRYKRGEDLSDNYKRQHKTLNSNYHNLQLSFF